VCQNSCSSQNTTTCKGQWCICLRYFVLFAYHLQITTLSVTPAQSQADVRVLDPRSILHSQLAHNSPALSGWPFPLLCQAHTPFQRVKRLAALVHWYVCCFTPLALALHSHCSGRRDHDSRSSIIVHLLQESIFEEILTESLPQLAIQAVNQTLNKEWTNLGLVSIIMCGPRFVHPHREKCARLACNFVTLHSGHR